MKGSHSIGQGNALVKCEMKKAISQYVIKVKELNLMFGGNDRINITDKIYLHIQLFDWDHDAVGADNLRS